MNCPHQEFAAKNLPIVFFNSLQEGTEINESGFGSFRAKQLCWLRCGRALFITTLRSKWRNYPQTRILHPVFSILDTFILCAGRCQLERASNPYRG
jgi:hypothetical protein